MAYQYRISLMIRTLPQTIDFEVRKDEWLRAQDLFDHSSEFYAEKRFLLFNSIEGHAVAVSLQDVQMVKFPLEIAPFASDQKHSEDCVRVWFRGRSEPAELTTGDDKSELAAFLVLLDACADQVQFSGFHDVDDELLQVNVQEVLLMTAPLHEVNEGYKAMRLATDEMSDGSDDIPF
jgi:hypothetical protein